MAQDMNQQDLCSEPAGKSPAVIGIGCKRGCSSKAIVSLVEAALASCAAEPHALFTHAAKNGEKGLHRAAELLRLPLHFLDDQLLRQASLRCVTRSPKVMAFYGLPSIAEAAALAGAGPSSQLLVARMSNGEASCAIAIHGQT